jgi:hypothetical protein
MTWVVERHDAAVALGELDAEAVGFENSAALFDSRGFAAGSSYERAGSAVLVVVLVPSARSMCGHVHVPPGSAPLVRG